MDEIPCLTHVTNQWGTIRVGRGQSAYFTTLLKCQEPFPIRKVNSAAMKHILSFIVLGEKTSNLIEHGQKGGMLTCQSVGNRFHDTVSVARPDIFQPDFSQYRTRLYLKQEFRTGCKMPACAKSPNVRCSLARMSSHGSNQGNPPALPDPAICRVKRFAIGYCDCLVDDPTSCRYALHFGDGHFCHNPDLKKVHRHGSRKLRVSHESGNLKWLKDRLKMESDEIKKL